MVVAAIKCRIIQPGPKHVRRTGFFTFVYQIKQPPLTRETFRM